MNSKNDDENFLPDSVSDTYYMNSFTYVFCIFIICFGIFYIYTSYYIDSKFNDSSCVNKTVKTLISIMQIYSILMVFLCFIIFEATFFKVFFDQFRWVFFVLLILYTITMIVCSVMIKNNISTTCLGNNYQDVFKAINNAQFVCIGLGLSIGVYILLLIFKKYYPAGKQTAVKVDIILRKLNKPEDGGIYYKAGDRTNVLSAETYQKLYKELFDAKACPVIIPKDEPEEDQQIVITLPKNKKKSQLP